MIDGGPSVLFDAVALLGSDEGFAELAHEAAARDFVADAFAHLKFIGYDKSALPLFVKAGVDVTNDEGLMPLDSGGSVENFLKACRELRIWAREKQVKLPAREASKRKAQQPTNPSKL